jgi:hypothetical protein
MLSSTPGRRWELSGITAAGGLTLIIVVIGILSHRSTPFDLDAQLVELFGDENQIILQVSTATFDGGVFDGDAKITVHDSEVRQRILRALRDAPWKNIRQVSADPGQPACGFTFQDVLIDRSDRQVARIYLCAIGMDIRDESSGRMQTTLARCELDDSRRILAMFREVCRQLVPAKVSLEPSNIESPGR